MQLQVVMLFFMLLPKSESLVPIENVMHAAKEASCRGVVYVSSPSVSYSKIPVLGEASPPALDDVLGHYSKTKSIAERIVTSDKDLPTVALRPHLVWGPGDTQLVGRIIERARRNRLVLVNEGSAIVDSTYIDNVSDALCAAAERIGVNESLSGRALVVSNGEPRSVADLMERICHAAGVTYSPRSINLRTAVVLGHIIEKLYALSPRAEPPLTAFTAYQLGISHWFDTRETQELLAWEPRISLDEGFSRLANSFASPGCE
jgi:nucleoside-diphosphate-sugar epimerase